MLLPSFLVAGTLEPILTWLLGVKICTAPTNWTVGKFPRFQHRPSLITTSKNLAPVPSQPYKCWNFRKANWKLLRPYITNHLYQELLSPGSSSIDEAYKTSVRRLDLAAAKFQVFLRAPQGEATSQLLPPCCLILMKNKTLLARNCQ